VFEVCFDKKIKAQQNKLKGLKSSF
jgi:hypothetical protein